MDKVVFFTGHRPPSLGGYETPAYEQTRQRLMAFLVNTITSWFDMGIRAWISGMAQGVDTIAAESVLRAKEQIPEIQLFAAIPYPSQAAVWRGNGPQTWMNILRRADRVYVVNQDPVKGQRGDAARKLDHRNHFMVDFPQIGVDMVGTMAFDERYPDLGNVMLQTDWQGKVVGGIAVSNNAERGGTANCIRYAKSKGVPMLVVDPYNTSRWAWR